ncbi:uncharacterized protein GGS25DRAFT_490142, partial [Hypoxylon fragiforme]|uniref:uncharacterized protein n=1 Tax=Hypoxylon fragiforme TaxID=63214 RepID=UPI0020C70408
RYLFLILIEWLCGLGTFILELVGAVETKPGGVWDRHYCPFLVDGGRYAREESAKYCGYVFKNILVARFDP